MALVPLAAVSDLSDRGVDVTDPSLAALMIAVASAHIRAAAGSPILEQISTVTLAGYYGEQWLDLPGRPVTAVSDVTVDGVAVTDYRLRASRLWRACGWSSSCVPADVSVTMTHGLAEVPANLIQLVCDFAILGIGSAVDGAHDPLVLVESIGDYSVTYKQTAAASAVASVMEVPPATRTWLRTQFGGGAGLVVHR